MLALCHPEAFDAEIYAELGIVEGNDPFLEWKELDMKTSQVCTSIF